MSHNTQTVWEDIVFEKRNKEYGAYAIRMSYSDNVLRGTLVVGLLVALFIGSSQFRSAVKTVLPVTCGGDVIELKPAPVIEKLKIPAQARPQLVRSHSSRNNFVATAAAVVEQPDVPTEANTGTLTEGEEDGESVVETVGGDTGTLPEIGASIESRGNEVFTVVEVMPSFHGGLAEMSRYLQRKLKYPASARRQGVEGTAFVSFVINGDGEVTDVQVIRGFYHDCDVEAARVVAAMPRWNAGKQHNRNVSVRMVIPIKFALAK